ncbi:MAG: hypothetical protein JW384_03120 [Nitrosomonadaceae bacterium]|nr:hypothetical protein [Nitrosomonadaceae bacterium]
MPIVKSLKKKFGISAPRVAARAVEYQELQAKAKVSGDVYTVLWKFNSGRLLRVY